MRTIWTSHFATNMYLANFLNDSPDEEQEVQRMTQAEKTQL